MKLEASVYIRTTPQAVMAFFRDIEAQFLAWHPDHILFHRESPGLKVGGSFYFEEWIGGKLLKKRVRFTRVERNLIQFAPINPLFRLFLPYIAFQISAESNGIRVTQTIKIRTGPLGAWSNRREFSAVRVHMREEGENMKRLLETRIQA